MATNKNNSNKNLTDVVGVISAVAGLATAATPLINNVIDNSKNVQSEKQEEKVKIPELYSKDFPIDLNEAQKLLEDCGLKSATSKLTLKDADSRYKDCFVMQVISSNPKQGTMVKIGTTVYLKCITEDVIKKSQQMFDDAERVKKELKEKKALMKQERKEKIQKGITYTVSKTGHSIEKIFKHAKSKGE